MVIINDSKLTRLASRIRRYKFCLSYLEKAIKRNNPDQIESWENNLNNAKASLYKTAGGRRWLLSQ